MVKNYRGIAEIIRRNQKTLKRLGVRRVGIFGSFAANKTKASSDVDLVVDFEKKTFDSYMDLKHFLESRFHRPVDLVLSDSVKPRLRNVILSSTVYV